MPKIDPIYTTNNCRAAYELQWSVSLFYRASISNEQWLAELTGTVERDGVRILNHRFRSPEVSQFLVSTTPRVSPSQVVRSLKGRLQHILRHAHPRAFHRNYFVRSVGAIKRNIIESYVATQVAHHRMADPAVQKRLRRYQVQDPNVDLSRIIYSGHGQYLCNLHLVLVHQDRWMEIRHEVLDRVRSTIVKAARKRGHRLSRAGIFTNHVHLALGFAITQSPEEVALCYLNNLAYAQGMRAIYQPGYYVRTFGEYDLGAITQTEIQCQS